MEFTVLKTKVTVSPFFFAVLTAFLLIDKNGIAGLVLLFSMLHELGHFLALLCAKAHPKEVGISLFGIHMTLPENLSTAKKCFVLSAGFFVNFVLSAAMFFLGKNTGGYINLVIGIFTFLPLASTDGGAILKMILEEFIPEKAERVFKMISLLFFSAVSLLLVFTAVITKNGFILIAVFYMMLCAIKYAAR